MARPREFDADEALDKAMRLFWAKGYHDSSIRDLVECTGVNYYGLYSVFEDKHGLFMAALDRYRRTVVAEFAAAVRAAEPTAEGLLGAFDGLFDLMTTEAGPRGCLMCNSAAELAPHDAEVAEKVKAQLMLMADVFEEWLIRAAPDKPADSRKAGANFLATSTFSLALLLRSGFDRTEVREQAKIAVEAVL